jgi:phage/plasmid-associated DNA primase
MDAKKIKSIVKTKAADKATFGTNPRDPWSTKADIAESAGLEKYLMSRGINPKFVSKDQKVAHSKSNQFKQWTRDHAMREDSVTPSPTMDRLREIKRKEREGKVIHHEESTLGSRADKLLARSHSAYHAGDKETSSRAHKLFMRAKEKHLSNPENAEKHRAHIMGGAGDYYKSKKPGQYVGDSVEVEGNVVSETNVCQECNQDPCACSHGFVGEAKEADYGGDYQSSVHAVKAKAEKKPVDMKSLAARMQASYRRDNEAKKVKAIPAMKENMMDPTAPSQAPVDGANSSNDCEPQPVNKQGLSKAARLIKKIHKQSTYGEEFVKEDLYDHEKEDKAPATAKAPKVKKAGSDEVTKEQPQAAAVLSGGKTMTGAPRDVVEIDPMMKMRKQTPDSQKNI